MGTTALATLAAPLCFCSFCSFIFSSLSLLIVGTSLQVYPAAGLYAYAKADTPIYIIDPADVPLRDGRITHIKEVATKGMETFGKIINDLL